MYLSISGKISTKENTDNQPIYLIYQYFVHRDASRNKELQECLRRNVENSSITKIFLLNEKIYSDKELGIQNDKIEQRAIVNRIKFKDIFNFVEKESLKGYIVTCNADIFFDKTIDNLRKSTMSTKKQLLAQLRFDYTNKQLGKCKLFGPRADSQDAWIWHSNFNPNKEEKIFNIMFGKPGCDNKLIYLFNLIGFEVVNQPYFVKTYHIQKSNKRDYDGNLPMAGPYMMKSPYIQNRQMTYTDIWGTVGWRLKNTHKTSIEATTNNFSRFITEVDNKVLGDFLDKRLKQDDNFCIAQIENDAAVLTSVVLMLNQLTEGTLFSTMSVQPKYQNNLQLKHLWNILNQLVGIIGTEEFRHLPNILMFANKYIEALQSAHITIGLSLWDTNYRILMSERKEQLFNGLADLLKHKQWVNKTTINIFNYLHDNPWLSKLNNQKLLIISPYTEKIKDQIDSKKVAMLYNFDIFSNCSFCFIKYTTWCTHLQDEIINMIGEYDVALCDCGMHGPIVSKYVYSVGKSCIDIGDILSLYFGLWSKGLMSKYKDIIQLYLNEHWKRIN